MRKEVPGPLWIALVTMGISILACLIIGLTRDPGLLLGAFANGLLLAGLYLGHKWAYVVTVAGTFLIVAFVAAKQGLNKAIPLFFVDCLALVPVLICTSYFFPKKDREPDVRL